MNKTEWIKEALLEDIPTVDVTTDAIFDKETSTAYIKAKELGVLSGLSLALEIFQYVGLSNIQTFKKDGDILHEGDIILEVSGLTKDILKSERLVLNVMQHASGIATETRRYTKQTSHNIAVILDTRKTLPHLRFIEKQAVLDGGGTNHRMNLSDQAMIKDNHIKAAGSMAMAVEKVRTTFPSVKVEIEVETIQMFQEALTLDVDIIMLDNMSLKDMKACVEMNKTNIKLEASGNVTLDRVRPIAETGVDYISVGAITHSVRALDLSMKFK